MLLHLYALSLRRESLKRESLPMTEYAASIYFESTEMRHEKTREENKKKAALHAQYNPRSINDTMEFSIGFLLGTLPHVEPWPKGVEGVRVFTCFVLALAWLKARSLLLQIKSRVGLVLGLCHPKQVALAGTVLDVVQRSPKSLRSHVESHAEVVLGCTCPEAAGLRRSVLPLNTRDLLLQVGSTQGSVPALYSSELVKLKCSVLALVGLNVRDLL